MSETSAKHLGRFHAELIAEGVPDVVAEDIVRDHAAGCCCLSGDDTRLVVTA